MAFLKYMWFWVLLMTPLLSFSQFVGLSAKVGLGHPFYLNNRSSYLEGVRPGPVLGLGTQFKLAEHEALQVELFYSQERRVRHYSHVIYSSDYMPGPSNYNLAITNHLLVLPVTFQNDIGRQRLWFWNFGLYASYWAKSHITYDVDGSRSTHNQNIAENERWSAGLTLGAGRKFKIAQRHELSVELKSFVALKDNIFKLSPTLLVGYEFGLKRKGS